MAWITDRIIVVPLDLSEFSLKALDAARQLVEDKAAIRVLHILPQLDTAEPSAFWRPVDDESRSLQTRAAMSAFLQEHGYEKMNITVRTGDPGTQIALFADDINAGLIVIPSHGRGMLTKMLLGSTTDRVVHLAHCPVLVLKEQRKKT
ncbi:MAG: universal stress protein [Planctomycetaceae bacterium]|jgi:nucleotide-binding universal stress UspA family protein|nr:universal stress protein [Planctomycetaceae bacterium]